VFRLVEQVGSPERGRDKKISPKRPQPFERALAKCTDFAGGRTALDILVLGSAPLFLSIESSVADVMLSLSKHELVEA
jgi:hypothetical protein